MSQIIISISIVHYMYFWCYALMFHSDSWFLFCFYKYRAADERQKYIQSSSRSSSLSSTSNNSSRINVYKVKLNAMPKNDEPKAECGKVFDIIQCYILVCAVCSHKRAKGNEKRGVVVWKRGAKGRGSLGFGSLYYLLFFIIYFFVFSAAS